MKEKNIRELAKRMGLVTVEDMCQYTIAQLVVKIANKVNELVDEVWRFETDVQETLKTQNENIQYLLGEGLLSEVENVFNGWFEDGTFDTLINQTALKKVNERIDETNAQLSQKANENDVIHLRDRFNEFENSGVSSESIQNKITSMVENGTINLNVVSKDMTNFMETGKNKFNKDDVVVGHIDVDGSIYNEDEASKNYRTSQFIYIGGATSVTISPRLRKAMLYDENKNPIPSTYVDSSSNLVVFPLTITISDTNAKYLRITVADNYKDEVQVEFGVSSTEYESFWCDFQNRRPVDLSDIGFCENEYNKFNKNVTEVEVIS